MKKWLRIALSIFLVLGLAASAFAACEIGKGIEQIQKFGVDKPGIMGPGIQVKVITHKEPKSEVTELRLYFVLYSAIDGDGNPIPVRVDIVAEAWTLVDNGTKYEILQLILQSDTEGNIRQALAGRLMETRDGTVLGNDVLEIDQIQAQDMFDYYIDGLVNHIKLE